MKEVKMKNKTFWLTIDRDQSTCPNPQKFALPSFLLEDQMKKNIFVSKRVLTRMHRCTAGVFEQIKNVPGENFVELGNQIPGEKATTTDTELQQSASGA